MAKKGKIEKTIRYNKWKEILPKIEGFFETYLVKKAPVLPMGLKKFMVAVWPYLILLGMIFNLPFLLSGGFIFNFTFLRLVGLGVFILQAMALPDIFRKRANGWKLLYYVVLINSVVLLFTENIFNFIIGTVVSLYLIFQIREFYSNE